MTDIPGLSQKYYDEYYNMSLIDDLGPSTVRFLHYNHLLEYKLATGRNKDLMDIEELKKINKV